MEERKEEIENIIYYLEELIEKIKIDKALKKDLQMIKEAEEEELQELEEIESERNAREYEEELRDRQREYREMQGF